MTAQAYSLDEVAQDLEEARLGALGRMQRSLGWVAMTGLTVTAATLVGMALAVVGAIGTGIVAVIALACVIVGAALVAAILLVIAGLCVVVGAVTLAVGVGAASMSALTAIGRAVGRGTGNAIERIGHLRAHPPTSSAA